ncbi:hypothetical protein LTR86_006376 [Recurvomyces mirabilis]|nr:hypothetical protein LTR86_006376 [Recurvomyces mirabilis]
MKHSTHYPTFGSWLKDVWLDILTLLAIGGLGLVTFFSQPLFPHSFPIWNHQGEIIYPQYDYPLRSQQIPTWVSALVAILVPTTLMLLMQIKVRSFHDLNNALFGLFFALTTTAVLYSVLKWFVGGLRPHFYAVCQPRASAILEAQAAERLMWFDVSVCTNPDKRAIVEAMQSFPSGHTAASFAVAVYTSLYFNAKLKLWSGSRATHWELVVLCLPILGAVMIGSSMIIDGSHHWYDVLAGAVLGTLMAVAAFRMGFASVFDWRNNHIALSKSKGVLKEPE